MAGALSHTSLPLREPPTNPTTGGCDSLLICLASAWEEVEEKKIIEDEQVFVNLTFTSGPSTALRLHASVSPSEVPPLFLCVSPHRHFCEVSPDFF